MFSTPIVLLFVSLAFYFIPHPFSLIGGSVIFVFFVISLCHTAIKYFSTEFAITDKRIIGKIGFWSSSSIEILLRKVEGVEVLQTFSGRILDFGTVIVSGVGGTHEAFNGIESPRLFARFAEEQIDKIQQKWEER